MLGKYSNMVQPSCTEFFSGIMNLYLYLMSILHIEMTQVVEILPQVRYGLILWTWSVLHSQYHGCWCFGDARSQDINNHIFTKLGQINLVPAGLGLNVTEIGLHQNLLHRLFYLISISKDIGGADRVIHDWHQWHYYRWYLIIYLTHCTVYKQKVWTHVMLLYIVDEFTKDLNIW